eukprot:6147_1
MSARRKRKLSGRNNKTSANKRRKIKKENKSNEPIYCICKKQWDGKPMVQCAICLEWFHFRCLKIKQKSIVWADEFNCPHCTTAKVNKSKTKLKQQNNIKVKKEYKKSKKVKIKRERNIRNEISKKQQKISNSNRNICNKGCIKQEIINNNAVTEINSDVIDKLKGIYGLINSLNDGNNIINNDNVSEQSTVISLHETLKNKTDIINALKQQITKYENHIEILRNNHEMLKNNVKEELNNISDDFEGKVDKYLKLMDLQNAMVDQDNSFRNIMFL